MDRYFQVLKIFPLYYKSKTFMNYETSLNFVGVLNPLHPLVQQIRICLAPWPTLSSVVDHNAGMTYREAGEAQFWITSGQWPALMVSAVLRMPNYSETHSWKALPRLLSPTEAE